MLHFQLLSLFLCVFMYLSVSRFQDASLMNYKRIKTFSNALNVVISEYFMKSSNEFDILILNKSCEDFASAVMLDIWKSNPNFNPSYFLTPYKNNKSETFNVSRSAIIFIDNFEAFKNYEIDHRVKLAFKLPRKSHFILITLKPKLVIDEYLRNSLNRLST